MDFFDKLGKKASEAYKITADKTGKLAKETKIKIKINDLKSQIRDVYEEIGQRVYQNHVREHDETFEKEVDEMCVKIDVLSDEIEGLLKQSLELKDKRQCKECFAEIDKDAKFCYKCGAKQDEPEPAKEVEVVENKEAEEKETEPVKEAETVKEETTSKEEKTEPVKEEVKEEKVEPVKEEEATSEGTTEVEEEKTEE